MRIPTFMVLIAIPVATPLAAQPGPDTLKGSSHSMPFLTSGNSVASRQPNAMKHPRDRSPSIEHRRLPAPLSPSIRAAAAHQQDRATFGQRLALAFVGALLVGGGLQLAFDDPATSFAGYTVGAIAGVTAANVRYGEPDLGRTMLGAGLGSIPLALALSLDRGDAGRVIFGGVGIVTVPLGASLFGSLWR